MRSQRQLRVGEEIRHALAAVFQRGDFHWPEGLSPAALSVTEVRVSPDLHNATAFIMPLGGIKMSETVQALNAAVGFFRHVIAKEVKLRFVPKLDFAADTSFDYANKITTLLQDPAVAKDLTATETDDK
ncbi:MAG: 30S ribosome-binding factor RbfA [Alphaproteobacteria bacterium]